MRFWCRLAEDAEYWKMRRVPGIIGVWAVSQRDLRERGGLTMPVRRAVVLSLMLLVTCLVACTRPNYEFFAAVQLRERAVLELREQVDRMSRFHATESPEGVSRPERMPDWAAGDYEVCVYWTSPIESRSNHPHEIRYSISRAWGWALVGRELEIHILEIGCEDEETGETIVLVDGWDEPPDLAED